MTISNVDLLRLRLDALFTHDGRGRMVRVNEPDGGRAPRFFLGRTRDGHLWRCRDDVAAATVHRLERLAAEEPVGDDLTAEPRGLGAMLEVLRGDGETPSLTGGPAFRFPDLLPPPAPVERISAGNVRLLGAFGWDPDAFGRELPDRWPVIAAVDGGAAVSVCYSARLSDHAAEAGVETRAAFRGRGFASTVVAEWARALRQSGRIPLYSTWWENAGSRAVARKLGLVHYATDLSLG